MSDIREELKKTLDEAEWAWLKAHADRDAVIWVSPDVDLLAVGQALAEDAAAKVADWLARGKLSKLTPEHRRTWDAEPARKFMTLIVQPYVLIQDPSLN